MYSKLKIHGGSYNFRQFKPKAQELLIEARRYENLPSLNLSMSKTCSKIVMLKRNIKFGAPNENNDELKWATYIF